jgi:hypothetical protein
MSDPTSDRTVLDREFLGIRSKLVELAAALDRVDRAEHELADDPRRMQIRSSLELLAADVSNRAERVQLEFSLPLD